MAQAEWPSSGRLEWLEGQPFSKQFGDVYFSRENGLAETHHVFLHHNALPSRWQQLSTPVFTIAETGFGTGLNFLCAWQLWRECAPNDATLHFVSTEYYPLSLADLRTALALWPQLAEFAQQLLVQYRYMHTGWHRLVFDQGKVCLTLLIGNAETTLPQLCAHVDAWFLDGFSPAKNADMWSEKVLAQVARLSHAGTSFATFTSAGQVRRDLEAQGFAVRKVPGFGKKREMLCGEFVGAAASSAEAGQSPKPPSSAIVIGAGLAGSLTADALARRGCQVLLLEAGEQPAAGASGNPVGIVYPKLGDPATSLSRLALLGYLYTLRFLSQLPAEHLQWRACGIVQLAHDAREEARQALLAKQHFPEEIVSLITAEAASNIAGIALDQSASWLPDAGMLNPAALCQHLLARHAQNIQLHLQQSAIALQQTPDGWQVTTADGSVFEASHVILANAHNMGRFSQTAHCLNRPVRGQISTIKANEETENIRTIICRDGYMTPTMEGQHCLGATYHVFEEDTSLWPQDHARNLELMQALGLESTPEICGGRASIRCTTEDYHPLLGPVLDAAQLASVKIRPGTPIQQLPWLEGLYTHAGLGSKGLVYAPICAEALAASLFAEPLPMDRSLVANLDPNRFLLRSLGHKRLLSGLSCHFS